MVLVMSIIMTASTYIILYDLCNHYKPWPGRNIIKNLKLS